MTPFAFGFQHRVVPLPLVKSGCHSLRERKTEVLSLIFLREMWKFMKCTLYFYPMVILTQLNHYTIGKCCLLKTFC